MNTWIATREAFAVAVESLRAHKLRSFLTLLGVVIATTTLIVVMAVVNGMNLYIAEHVANLGANVFNVFQFQWQRDYQYWLRARRRNKPVRMAEYGFLKDNLRGYKNIGAVAHLSSGPAVRYKRHTIYETSIRGVTPSMVDIGHEKVDYGRYVNGSDYEHNARVCFIGQDVVDELFPGQNPLGEEVSVGGRPFRVIGVAQKIGTMFGQSQDNFVLIPLTTLRKVFVARPQLIVNIQAWSAGQMQELQDEARALMRLHRHLSYSEDDTFGINSSQTIMNAWRKLTASIFAATIGVVAIFMVVGGIVIMNIMLASVTERTHEIGIRKALGARRHDIMLQFLVESGLMATAGGAAGVIMALAVNRIVQIFFTSSVPLNGVLVSLFLSAAVGIFFGIYPASQAAKLSPIQALRAER